MAMLHGACDSVEADVKEANRRGRMEFKDGIISFEGAKMSSEKWSVPLSRVAVIAEFTDPGEWGSYDWVLILIENSDVGYVAPMYADGMDEVLSTLRTALDTEICPALASSVDFSSRIMWPPQLTGQPLYRIVPSPRGSRFGGWLRRSCQRLWGSLYCELTPEVKSLLSDRGL